MKTLAPIFVLVSGSSIFAQPQPHQYSYWVDRSCRSYPGLGAFERALEDAQNVAARAYGRLTDPTDTYIQSVFKAIFKVNERGTDGRYQAAVDHVSEILLHLATMAPAQYQSYSHYRYYCDDDVQNWQNPRERSPSRWTIRNNPPVGKQPTDYIWQKHRPPWHQVESPEGPYQEWEGKNKMHVNISRD
ncbi:MAG: hypothetical protein Q9227_004943 [Pyrenula ochraceoflavens]